MKKILIAAIFCLMACHCRAAELSSWGVSLCMYAQREYLPATKYHWNWREATLLRSFMNILEEHSERREEMMEYIRTAIDTTLPRAHAAHPNAVASCAGLAFLARNGQGEEYMDKALEMYAQYMQIPRASNGGVSHRADVIELWDDTIYMIGLFLVEMYRATDDEKYLDELCLQIRAHAEYLADPATGLWYHGWDSDAVVTDDGCCQPGWSDNPARRNDEFWGRGNGWIAMTLADLLAVIPAGHPARKEMEKGFVRMMETLLTLQNGATGHWLQLPLRTEDLGRGNFIESSATAMFGYAMSRGVRSGVLSAEKYLPAIRAAHSGMAHYSLRRTGEWLTVANVCAGTCIGDRDYYYRREVVEGTEFALGAAIMFANEFSLIRIASDSNISH